MTVYLYDGMDVLKEYTEAGSPLRSYYYGAGEIVSEKMFGFHGRKGQGREGNLQTRGGLLYYGYDALGNVTDLSDHLGNEVTKYRYDAFGGLFTSITAPYNTQGYTGQTYDPTSGLLDYNARWYSAKDGRFTAKDTFQGFVGDPSSHNLYSYVSNNPVRYTDPTGHWQEGDENLPPETQLKIIDLTEKWFGTDDEAERDRIHEEAERLRNGGGTSTGTSSNGGSSNSGGYESQLTLEQQLNVKLSQLAHIAGPQIAEKIASAIEETNSWANINFNQFYQIEKETFSPSILTSDSVPRDFINNLEETSSKHLYANLMIQGAGGRGRDKDCSGNNLGGALLIAQGGELDYIAGEIVPFCPWCAAVVGIIGLGYIGMGVYVINSCY